MRVTGAIVVTLTLAALSMAQGRGGRGGDPAGPIFWSAEDMKSIDEGAGSRVSPATHMAGERLTPSASVIYRTGPSQAEAHQTQGDFIFVREGEGSILVGGEIVGGAVDRPGEIRGESITGGVEYPVEAGDTLYIPADTPHQFFVEEGKHWIITIVKVAPQP